MLLLWSFPLITLKSLSVLISGELVNCLPCLLSWLSFLPFSHLLTFMLLVMSSMLLLMNCTLSCTFISLLVRFTNSVCGKCILTFFFRLAPHFVIFSTRVPGYWYKNIPHWIFTVCILATQVLALFFSVYGVFGEGEEVAPCGWPWGIAVLAISLVYFMILDVVKVWLFRRWNFELTAKLSPTPKRKAKLAARGKEALQRERLENAWKKVIDPVEAHQMVAAFKLAAQ